jgi:pimeloyl-ACP methyl ester carboxylesterase
MVYALAALAAVSLLLAWAYTPDRSMTYLTSKYNVTEADFVDIDGARLRFKDTGPRGAPAIILLHGFGASLETWEPWAAQLSKTYRVIRFDLPGFGLTGADPRGDYSDQRACTLLAGLMHHFGIAKASIIGNSLGGKIAWNFAVSFPTMVTSLVLISPDGFASPGFEYGKPAKLPFILKLLPFVMPRSMLRMNLAVAYANPKNLSDQTLSRYDDMMRGPGNRQAMLARMQQVILQPPEPALREITAPTLLLWGEQDRMIPFANSADYMRNIPHAQLMPLPTLGHVPFEESPEISLPPVAAFLSHAALRSISGAIEP